MIAVTGKKFSGSYVVHRKQFLKNIPVPPLAPEEQTYIETRVQEMRALAVELRHEHDSALVRTMEERRTLLSGEIEAVLSSAYELDAALVTRVLGSE